MPSRTLVAVGAFLGLIAVAAGAFGTHGLEGRLDERQMQTFEIAVRYQMYHTLAIFCSVWISTKLAGNTRASGLAIKSGWVFAAGCMLFSGSLYVLVFTGAKWLGMVAPIGGTAFMVGWAMLGISALVPANNISVSSTSASV